MMTEQAKIYLILKNDDNERCIFLTPEKTYTTEPIAPEIIYANTEHAILYRNPDEAIILDYFPETEKDYLKNNKEILVVEYDVKTNQPTKEYMAKISIVKKLPDITKNMITKSDK